MGIDYSLIAGLALYFFIVKLMASTRLKPISASLIVALGYFAVSSIPKAIIFSGYDAPLWQLVSWVPISTLLFQLLIGYVAFRKLSDSEDSYGEWIFWGIAGCVGIFYLAPFVAMKLFGGL